MLALAALVVMAGSQLVEAAGPRSTAGRPTQGVPWPAGDPEGLRYGPLACALCLAVADWLNTSLVEAHKQKKVLSSAEVSAVLANACRSGFEGYDLWPPPLKEDTDNKMAKVREIAERHSQRAPPPALWKERLRMECWWYLEEAGEEELYRQWRGMLAFEPQRLDHFLCRNSGWLRTCVNLSEEDLPSLHPRVVKAPPGCSLASEAAKMATFSISRFRLICTRLLCWRF